MSLNGRLMSIGQWGGCAKCGHLYAVHQHIKGRPCRGFCNCDGYKRPSTKGAGGRQ